MTKHTPGPWTKVAEVGGIGCYIRGVDQPSIVLVLDRLDGETEANANLIIAAPDLLRACRYAETFIELESGTDPPDGLALIRKAIAKAEGQ